MVQILATIFFSAAALSALGVIVGSFSDNLAEVRLALGMRERFAALPATRVRVRPVVAQRGLAKESAGTPLRAAA